MKKTPKEPLSTADKIQGPLKKAFLKEAYAQAEDPDRKAIIDEWSILDGQDWE